MTKFFNKFKKPCFGPIFGPFPNFVVKKIFYGKSGCHTQLHALMITIPRKRLGRRTDRRKNGQTLFYRTLLAAGRDPKTINEMCGRFSSLPICNWEAPYKIEQPLQGMKSQEEKKSIWESD